MTAQYEITRLRQQVALLTGENTRLRQTVIDQDTRILRLQQELAAEIELRRDTYNAVTKKLNDSMHLFNGGNR